MNKVLDQIIMACQSGVSIKFMPDFDNNAIAIQVDVDGKKGTYRREQIIDALSLKYDKEPDSMFEFMLDRMIKEALWHKSQEVSNAE